MDETMIDIPVKPHVRQYLEINTFIKKPFRLNEDDPVGMYLIELLRPKRKADLPLRYNPANIITVSLGKKKEHNYKMWLPKPEANKFNLFVSKLIFQEFKEFITEVLIISESKKIDPLIKKFETKYCLENTSMSFGTLKRHYYRHRDGSKYRMKSS